MSLTLDEILGHEERLQREIVERECLLAAFKVLHGYAANGHGPKSMDLGSIVSALAPSALAIPLKELTAPPAPATPPPIPAPYVHPELAAIFARHGSMGEIVVWAIQRMTADYSVTDIAELLRREGALNISGAQISVVISRLKNRGEIEEIRQGRGRSGSIFRKPESATPPGTETTNPIHAAESTTGSTLAP